MKKILGSLLFACMLLAAPYTIELDKKEAFVKEPIFLRLSYFDPHKEEIIWVRFAPKKSADYKVVLLKKTSTTDGFVQEYLLFALRPGSIIVPLDLTIKRATKQELQNDVLGTGYEQTKILEGETTHIPIQHLRITVKQTPKADLYGDFRLWLKVDKTKVKRYEPVYATLTLKGVGYDELPRLQLRATPGVKILQDKPIKKVRYDAKGAHITYSLTYAFISKNDFAIQPMQLKLFDFTNLKTLTTPTFHITVQKGSIAVDKEDNPPKIKPVFDRFKKIVFYIGLFASGVVTGVLLFVLLMRRYKEHIRILLAKDAKELLRLIAPYPNMSQIRTILDEAITQNRKINLFAMKKKILKDLP